MMWESCCHCTHVPERQHPTLTKLLLGSLWQLCRHPTLHSPHLRLIRFLNINYKISIIRKERKLLKMKIFHILWPCSSPVPGIAEGTSMCFNTAQLLKKPFIGRFSDNWSSRAWFSPKEKKRSLTCLGINSVWISFEPPLDQSTGFSWLCFKKNHLLSGFKRKRSADLDINS